MPNELQAQSKTALVKRVQGLMRSRDRQKAEALEIGERVTDVIGGGLAMTTGVAIGVAEARFRNKDGSPLSLGPVPLPLAVATAATAVGLWTGSKQAAYTAAGAFGAYGQTLGKAWGAQWLARAGKVSGVGEDDALSAAENAAIWGR